jgi:8-oxo-dGTP diphosphatase
MEELIDIYDRDGHKTGEVLPRSTRLAEGQYMLYVLALIEAPGGRFLITRRALDKHWAAGAWEIPGGGVSAGETPEQAIVREIREETGLDVSGQPATPVYRYENVDLDSGDNYFGFFFHFHLDITEDDVTLQTEEAIDCKLATWEDIKQIHAADQVLHFERIGEALTKEGLVSSTL